MSTKKIDLWYPGVKDNPTHIGHGRPCGRVWFGWSAEVEQGETEADVLAALQAKADEQEKIESEAFDKRHRRERDQ